MNSRAFANVLESFTDDAVVAFSFLSDEFGLAGPDLHSVLMPSVTYAGSGVRYRIELDTDDKSVVTQVEKDLGEGRLVAELARLVWAAGIGSANQVSRNANTVHNLKRSLETQAALVRRLHSLVTGADAESVMRKAGARWWRA